MAAIANLETQRALKSSNTQISPSNYPTNHMEKPNFYFRMNFITRTILYAHGIRLLRYCRSNLQEPENDNGQEPELQLQGIPELMEQHKCMVVSMQTGKQFDEKLSASEKPITRRNLLSWIFKSNAKKVLLILLFVFIESAAWIIFSLLSKALFSLVHGLMSEEQLVHAYLYAVGIGILWLLSDIAKNNQELLGSELLCQIRAQLLLLIYKKLMSMTNYSIKSQEMGKIINLISSDFSKLEILFTFIFKVFMAPFSFIAVIVVFSVTFGWTVVIFFGLMLLTTIFQYLLTRKMGDLIKSINLLRDERIKNLNMIIAGIKALKMYSWETYFERQSKKLKNKEKQYYLVYSFVFSFSRSITFTSSVYYSIIFFSFTYYLGDEGIITAANIFFFLQIFILIKVTMFCCSIGFETIQYSFIVLDRFVSIFNCKNFSMERISDQEISKAQINLQEIVQVNDDKKDILVFENFNGYWKIDSRQKPSLKQIDLLVAKGELLGITGPVGSGKSTLLAAILNQLPYYSGKLVKNGKISYVEQEPFMIHATVKDNILFGLPFDEEKYSSCVNKACLQRDFKNLKNGDATIIGEKGSTISGGQKARISLARAIYSDSDIYLLDDPLSAVDSKVAKQLFQKGILGLKPEKIVILVSHHVSYLQKCDRVVIMKDGAIKKSGNPIKLRQELQELAKQDKEEKQDEESVEYLKVEEMNECFSHHAILENTPDVSSAVEQIEEPDLKNHQTKKSEKSIKSVSISFKSFLNFIFYNHWNKIIFPVVFTIFVGTEINTALYYRFITQYDKIQEGKSYFINEEVLWTILGLMAPGSFVLIVTRFFLVGVFLTLSNQEVYNQMLRSLLKAPLSYFNENSSGSILNKFSNDMNNLQINMMFLMIDVIEGPILILVMFANMVEANFYFLIPATFCLLFFIILFVLCRKIIVASKQLEARKKSPVYRHFTETVCGITQISTYQQKTMFMEKFINNLDTLTRASLTHLLIIRSFPAVASFFAIIIMTGGMVMGLSTLTQENAALYKVSVLFSMEIINFSKLFLKNMANIKGLLICFQQTQTIRNIIPEKERLTYQDQQQIIIKGKSEHPNELNKNQLLDRPIIEFKNLSLKYSETGKYVLRKLNINIRKGEKIGIIGRTGAGKSSLLMALLRLVQPEQQTLYQIQEENGLKMDLHTLRSRISSIPQSPFFFLGTIRQNLDPYQESQDEKIWEALKNAEMKASVFNLPNKLDTNIQQINDTLSIGQKQLLCLARVLLQRNNILVLDEPTSNVDIKTEQTIQKCIRQNFKQSTVITIAHRLCTIADSDIVIIMEKGKIIERGIPYQLLQKPKSKFIEMVSHTGSHAQQIYKISKDKYLQINSKRIQ